MGVEPTKDRLAAPPGFEVRTPHRGRFPSTVRLRRLLIRRAAEQVEPVFVDAAQIAAPQRDAVTVEEFEDLDGDLAAVVEPVAEFGGGELPGRRLRRQIGGNFHHLRHGAAKKEMIVGNLVDLAEAAEQLEKPPDVGFISADHAGDVADARRAKALLVGNQRSDAAPQRFLGGGQPHFVARQPNPGAVQCYLLDPR